MSKKIVQLNKNVITGQLKELVRGSVEETLNELLEQEAETLTQAARYERSEVRQEERPKNCVHFLKRRRYFLPSLYRKLLEKARGQSGSAVATRSDSQTTDPTAAPSGD